MNLREHIIRMKMFKVRREIRPGVPFCDVCGERPGTERHHIVNRNATVKDSNARDAADDPLLCALVCQECHIGLDAKPRRYALLQKLYKINGHGDPQEGYARMKEVFDKIPTPLLWELPEPFRHDNESEGHEQTT